MATFDPDHDIPNLDGKTIVVTGGTAGLGRETITNLVKHGSPRVYFTGRNEASAKETLNAAAAVNPSSVVTFLKCDLNDLAAVKAAASTLAAAVDRIDIIFCNAGVMATPAGLSKDGFETQFATNHLGHAMLVRQLLPKLQTTASTGTGGGDARVVFNTSMGYMFASKIDYATLRTTQESLLLGAFRRYGQSKLANILYPAELARQHPDITFVSIHPGVIKTDLITSLSTFNRCFTEITTFRSQVSVREGVKNQLWAATALKDEIATGRFYEPVGRPGILSAAAKDAGLAGELYTWTNDVLDGY